VALMPVSGSTFAGRSVLHGAYGVWNFVAPSDTSIAGVRLWRDGPSVMWGGGEPFGYILRGMPGSFDLEAHVAGDPNFGASFESHAWTYDSSARLLSIDFGCIWNDGTDGCGPTPGQTLRINRAELDLRDDAAPDVTGVSAEGTPSSPASIAFTDVVVQ